MAGLFDGKVERLERVDSTNTRLKKLAAQGAPEGTVLLAEEQTAGRGTGSRSFFSPGGEGLYLSVLLRPKAPLAEVLTLTGWVAVAVRDGIEQACGAPCGIKWLNDIYLNGRKLCGILTELSLTAEGEADFVVVGIGVNLTQTAETFSAQGLGGIATSLRAEGYPAEREALAASVLRELEKMYRQFPCEKEAYLEKYRARCLTLGRQVCFLQDKEHREGAAVGVDEAFALIVECERKVYTVSSGTVHLMERGRLHE